MTPPDPATGLLEAPAADAAATPPQPPRRSVLRDAVDWSELRQTPYGVGPAVVIALILGFQTFDTFGFAFAGPEIIREYEISFRTLNSVVALLTTVGPFLGIGVAWYLDRRNRVPVFVAGTLVSGIASVLTSVTTTAWTMGMTRAVDGSVEGAVNSAQFSLLSDYYPPTQRGRIFAFVNLLESMGSLLGRLVVGLLLTWLGVRLTFVLLGSPLILLAVLAAVVLREPVRGYFERREFGADEEVARTEDEPVSLGESFRTVWATRTLRRAFFAMGIVQMGYLPFAFFFQFMLAEVYGLNAAQRGALFIPAAIAGMAGTFLGGGLIDTFSKRSPRLVFGVVAGFLMVFVVAVVVIAFQPPVWLIATMFTVATFGSSLGPPSVAALASQVISPTVRTMGLQVLGLSLVAAGPFQALVAWPLFEEGGYPAVMLLAAGVGTVGLAVFASAGAFFELDRRNAMASAMASDEWRRTRASGEDKLLVCRDVTVHYGNVQVLFGVDFDVEEGQIIALLGTNGAGKSTLLRAISGVTEASGGAVVFDGRDITHMPPHEIAGRRVVYMPGGKGIFPGLTVRDNLLLGAWMVQEDRDQRLAEAMELFPRLAERSDALAGSLSGGEQQQLSLAQAFLANPRLLCIDELSLGLSPAVVGELLEKVREIHARGTTIIIVEQSVNVALQLADRAIFMEKGEVRFFGETSELLRRPDILRAVYVKGSGAMTSGPAAQSRSSLDRERELAAGVTALSLHDISVNYGGVKALDGVTFDVADGAVLGLIGPNGSGKTTLFDVISGFTRPATGTVTYLGEDVTRRDPQQRAAAGLIRRFQDARLFPSLTVHETILLALDQQLPTKHLLLNASAVPAARRNERKLRRRTDELIELLELGAFRDKFVKELSTGLRRIVDIACTIAREPRLLLLDEPSSGIAQAEAEALAPLLRRIQRETGTTMLVIEHDIPLLTRVVDELLVLETGRVLTRGRPDDVLEDERVIRAYLGDSEAAQKRSGGLR